MKIKGNEELLNERKKIEKRKIKKIIERNKKIR